MVWVFKTSVEDRSQVEQLLPVLNSFILPEGKWNIDLDDCDKILRIERKTLIIAELIKIMNRQGFLCEELVD